MPVRGETCTQHAAMDELLGARLLRNHRGEEVKTSEALQGKVVGLLFSGSWCSS